MNILSRRRSGDDLDEDSKLAVREILEMTEDSLVSHTNRTGIGRSNSVLSDIESEVLPAEQLIKMVVRVQRAYRMSTYVYRYFGPTLFVNSKGRPCYGQLKFDGRLETAPWMSVAPTSSTLRLVKLFDCHWRLPKPEVIITVTGGAQDFALTSQQLLAFDRGLCGAALSAKAWIFSAGSDAGVMRLVGDALARHEVGLPLIGVFPWGVTNGREQLARKVNGTCFYRPSPPSRDGAPLNSNHTHFVLVDTGKSGAAAWGSEIQLRSQLEATISHVKNVPIVQLVVQGGPGTLAAVESTALTGIPIVCLVDSGGAAAAIHAYCTGGLGEVEERFRDKEPTLRTIKALHEAYGGRQLTFYRLGDEGRGFGDRSQDMSSALLDAIVKKMNAPPVYSALPLGSTLKHPDYGFGTVTEVGADGTRVVTFENGSRQSVGQDHSWKLLEPAENSLSARLSAEAASGSNTPGGRTRGRSDRLASRDETPRGRGRSRASFSDVTIEAMRASLRMSISLSFPSTPLSRHSRASRRSSRERDERSGGDRGSSRGSRENSSVATWSEPRSPSPRRGAPVPASPGTAAESAPLPAPPKGLLKHRMRQFTTFKLNSSTLRNVTRQQGASRGADDAASAATRDTRRERRGSMGGVARRGSSAVSTGGSARRSGEPGGRDSLGGAAHSAARLASNAPDPLLTKTLVLTVTWDRPELARRILSGLDAQGKAAGGHAGDLSEISVAMQRGLEMGRYSMVKLLLELPGFTPRRVNMGRLFLQPDETKFLSNDRQLQKRVRKLDHSAPFQQEVADERRMSVNYFGYQKALRPFYASISPILAQLLRTTTATQPHDIFIWLVCHGSESLARCLWPKCDLPVHVALLGACVATRMSRVLIQGSAQATQRAALMQEWAVGAMEMAPDEAHAHHVLELEVAGRYSALDIALRTQAKPFLAQRHCLTLMDQWWRGRHGQSAVHLREGSGWAVLAVQALCPFVNRHLWGQRPAEAAAAAAAASGGVKNIYDALVMYMNISASERARVNSAWREELRKPPRHTILTPIRGLFHNAQEAPPHAEASRWVRVRDFYSIPKVKLLFRFGTHLIRLTLYIVQIFSFADPNSLERVKADDAVAWHAKLPLISDGAAHEVAWLVMEGGLILDGVHQLLMRQRTNEFHLSAFARVRSLVSLLLTLCAVALRVAMESLAAELRRAPCDEAAACYATAEDGCCAPYEAGVHVYHAYQIIYAMKTIDVAFGLLRYLSEHKQLGVLIIMVEEMIEDVLNFLVLFLVVTFAFALGMTGLQKAGWYETTPDYDDTPDNANRYEPFFNTGAFWAPLWAIFGMFDLMQMQWLTSALLWCYSFVGSIVLVNLLIAQMADTYSRVKRQSEVENIYSSCMRLFEHPRTGLAARSQSIRRRLRHFPNVRRYREVLLAVPPVLNAPIILVDLACAARQWLAYKLRKRRSLIHELLEEMRLEKERGGTRKASLIAYLRHGSVDRSDKSPGPGSAHGTPRVGVGGAVANGGAADERHTTVFLDTSREVLMRKAQDKEMENFRLPRAGEVSKYDGKLFAEAYLKNLEELEGGTVKAIANSLHSGFKQAHREREEEYEVLRGMLEQLRDQAAAQHELAASTAAESSLLGSMDERLRHLEESLPSTLPPTRAPSSLKEGEVATPRSDASNLSTVAPLPTARSDSAPLRRIEVQLPPEEPSNGISEVSSVVASRSGSAPNPRRTDDEREGPRRSSLDHRAMLSGTL